MIADRTTRLKQEGLQMGQNLSQDRSWNEYSHSQHLSSAEIAEQLIGNGFFPIPVKAKPKNPRLMIGLRVHSNLATSKIIAALGLKRVTAWSD